MSVQSGLSAQTLFNRPDTTPNYSAYRYPDECMAAVIRVTTKDDGKEVVWRDTLSFEASLAPWQRTAAVDEIARQCYVNVDVDTIPMTSIITSSSFLVAAKRENEAERLLLRYLDSAKFGDLGLYLQRIAGIYQSARPSNPKMIEKFANVVRARIPDDSIVVSLYVKHLVFSFAVAQGNFDAAEMIETEAKQLLQLHEREYMERFLKKDKEWKSSYIMAKRLFPLPFREEFSQAAKDSLLVSTEALRKLRVNTWRTFVDENAKDNEVFEGLKVPTIDGNWYYANDYRISDGKVMLSDRFNSIPKPQRPVPGKVNAVAFLQGGCHSRAHGFAKEKRNNGRALRNCWPEIAALKRLKNKFPELEITIVTKTYGDYANATPLTPKDEADTLASYFLGFYQIPGVHIVAEGEFVRIPGMDQRRVDTKVPYEYGYEIDGLNFAQDAVVLLIDETGRIFHADGIVGYREVLAQRKIEIVNRRLLQHVQTGAQ